MAPKSWPMDAVSLSDEVVEVLWPVLLKARVEMSMDVWVMGFTLVRMDQSCESGMGSGQKLPLCAFFHVTASCAPVCWMGFEKRPWADGVLAQHLLRGVGKPTPHGFV